MTKKDLVQFEEEIAELFNAAKILAPVHLYYGNEEQIIKVFKNVSSQDWVFCSWRSHYQCLLKGVPQNEIKEELENGKCISNTVRKYNWSNPDIAKSHPTEEYNFINNDIEKVIKAVKFILEK